MKNNRLIFYPENIKSELEDKAFIIFGLGRAGKLLFKTLGLVRPVLILDNDRSKQGNTFYGIPIVCPESIKYTNGLVIVITTLNYHVVIYQILSKGNENIDFLIPSPDILYGFQ